MRRKTATKFVSVHFILVAVTKAQDEVRFGNVNEITKFRENLSILEDDLIY